MDHLMITALADEEYYVDRKPDPMYKDINKEN